jgi:hypothetical protein
LKASVTRELIRDNQMLASKDGGDILPSTKILINYIHKEVQAVSVVERRTLLRENPVQDESSSPEAPLKLANFVPPSCSSLQPKPSAPTDC